MVNLCVMDKGWNPFIPYKQTHLNTSLQVIIKYYHLILVLMSLIPYIFQDKIWEGYNHIHKFDRFKKLLRSAVIYHDSYTILGIYSITKIYMQSNFKLYIVLNLEMFFYYYLQLCVMTIFCLIILFIGNSVLMVILLDTTTSISRLSWHPGCVVKPLTVYEGITDVRLMSSMQSAFTSHPFESDLYMIWKKN